MLYLGVAIFYKSYNFYSMSKIPESFKNIEGFEEEYAEARAAVVRSNKRRNGILIPHNSSAYEELMNKMYSEPGTQPSLSSVGSVPSEKAFP